MLSSCLLFILYLSISLDYLHGFTIPVVSNNHRGGSIVVDRTTRRTTTTKTTSITHSFYQKFLWSTKSRSSSSLVQSSLVEGPDPSTKPDYSTIHGPLGERVDNACMELFRTKLAEQCELDNDTTYVKKGYDGIIQLALGLNSRYDANIVQEKAQKTLINMFPKWLPKWYKILFSKPLPKFSARMNAWATKVFGTWLMGECGVIDIQTTNNNNNNNNITLSKQGLLVKRCRFLQESQCASVCVNACKVPTQKFFIEQMGIPLLMEPNYDTYECTFSFGIQPTQQTELDAYNTPCLQHCSQRYQYKNRHYNNNNQKQKQYNNDIENSDNNDNENLCMVQPTINKNNTLYY